MDRLDDHARAPSGVVVRTERSGRRGTHVAFVGMGKKAGRRRGRDRAGSPGASTWVEVGRGDGNVRSLMEGLHLRYRWLDRVDDRSVRIEELSDPGGLRVSVRSDCLPSDWTPPDPEPGTADEGVG